MKKFILLFSIISIFLIPKITTACSVCFGVSSNQSISKGLDLAIIILIGITGTVLSGIATFFVYLVRRSREKNKITFNPKSIIRDEDFI
tara:strand:- start:10275 stop:10541 length:267 start_codon:yes stop_codon:yes gene_type:complete